MHKCPCINVLNIDTWKTRDPKFEGVSNLKFFCMIEIYKIVAIFQFFIMADTDIPFPLTLRKMETQTLGGLGNLKFFCTINIYEMAAIFQFFIMADTDISFPSTLRKPGTQNFGGLVI